MHINIYSTCKIIEILRMTFILKCFQILYICRHLRKEVHKKLMINLCIALTGLYATFIISTFSMGVWQWCIVVSAMLQYFFLATFFWMAADAIHLFRKLVQVFKPDFKNYVGIAIAVCWGLLYFTHEVIKKLHLYMHNCIINPIHVNIFTCVCHIPFASVSMH